MSWPLRPRGAHGCLLCSMRTAGLQDPRMLIVQTAARRKESLASCLCLLRNILSGVHYGALNSIPLFQVTISGWALLFAIVLHSRSSVFQWLENGCPSAPPFASGNRPHLFPKQLLPASSPSEAMRNTKSRAFGASITERKIPKQVLNCSVYFSKSHPNRAT